MTRQSTKRDPASCEVNIVDVAHISAVGMKQCLNLCHLLDLGSECRRVRKHVDLREIMNKISAMTLQIT